MGSYFDHLRLPAGAPDAIAAVGHLTAEVGLVTQPGPFSGPG